MMTLDEVINELEYWDETDAYPECFYDDEVVTDTLHYLKAFRDAKDALDAEREKTIEAYCQWKDAKEKLEAQTSQIEISDNLPLTWDELKTMEGKPVWVERNEKYCYPRWFIIERIYKWDSIDDSTMVVQPDDDELFLSEHGKTWNAYRKERS